MKYYIIAGEASGDMHGGNLMKAIKKLDPNAVFRVWGGEHMQQQGGSLAKHYKDLAFMGFAEVAKNLRTIFKNLSFCKKDITQYQPDVLILVDYPGFNLRIAEFAKKHQIKVIYYISPQVWAWKSSRVKKIKQAVDRMLTILPFEKNFYKKFDYEVDYVGHPLLDSINNYPPVAVDQFKKQLGLDDRKIIALLPGSRKQEIEKKLPIMLAMQPHFTDYQFVVAAAPSIEKDFYQQIDPGIKLVPNRTYELLQLADAALVTSGTATLETTLFGVPQVVCYKGGELSYQIAKRLIKHIKYISLVNLIADKPLVKELIQHELTPENLIRELAAILTPEGKQTIKQGYRQLVDSLGNKGASDRAASIIYQELNRNS